MRRDQMTIKKKRGRPHAHEDREALQLVAFKADSEVMAALGELERAVAAPGAAHGRRSQAIRKAILDSRDRLRAALQEKV